MQSACIRASKQGILWISSLRACLLSHGCRSDCTCPFWHVRIDSSRLEREIRVGVGRFVFRVRPRRVRRRHAPLRNITHACISARCLSPLSSERPEDRRGQALSTATDSNSQAPQDQFFYGQNEKCGLASVGLVSLFTRGVRKRHAPLWNFSMHAIR